MDKRKILKYSGLGFTILGFVLTTINGSLERNDAVKKLPEETAKYIKDLAIKELKKQKEGE